MSCVFCGIVTGEEAATLVARDGHTCAFLDTRPLFKGHVLVVTNPHVASLPALAPEAVAPLFEQVRRISVAVERGLGADGTFIAVNNTVSQSVPHLHVHVVPRHRGDKLRGFFWPRLRYDSDEERDDFARRIAAAL